MRWSRTYAKTTGLWADALADAHYERTLHFDLSTVVRNMAGPSNPHKRLPTSALAERGIADAVKLGIGRNDEAQGLMPDGAVIIAAITSCTNTSNPRNVIAAGLLARNALAKGLQRKPWVKSSLAPGSKVVELYLKEANLLDDLEATRFRHRCVRLHHLQRHERRTGPEPFSRKSSIATYMPLPCFPVTGISTVASIPTPNRLFWPRRPWSLLTPSPVPSVSTSRRTRLVFDADGHPVHAKGYLAV